MMGTIVKSKNKGSNQRRSSGKTDGLQNGLICLKMTYKSKNRFTMKRRFR